MLGILIILFDVNRNMNKLIVICYTTNHTENIEGKEEIPYDSNKCILNTYLL